MLKKGPEIKLSDLRVPGFVSDIYHDLRERHLLPLVAVLAVAIVAVPIALGGSSESEEAPTPESSVLAPSESTGSPASQIVVTKATPELRNYQRRLNDLSATDPFRQLYAGNKGEGGSGEAEAGAGGSGEEIEGSGSGESAPAPAPEPLPDEVTSDQAEDAGGKHYSWAVDVRVVPVSTNGKPSKAEPTVRRNLPGLTMLPSRETPALIFIGPSKDGKKAVMVVSDEVQAMFGDAVCVLGSETCEMLVMEPGVPETFVYGDNAVTFRIEVRKVQLVVTDKLNRGSFDQGGKGKGGSQGSGKSLLGLNTD